MRDLEQRRNAESLCEVGAQTGEGQVVEENIALHLLCDVLDGAGVGQAKGLSSCLESRVCVPDGREQAIVGDGRESAGLVLGDRRHWGKGSGGKRNRRHGVDFCCCGRLIGSWTSGDGERRPDRRGASLLSGGRLLYKAVSRVARNDSCTLGWVGGDDLNLRLQHARRRCAKNLGRAA